MDNLYLVGKSAFMEYRYLRSHGYMYKLKPVAPNLSNATTSIDAIRDSLLIDDLILQTKIDLLVNNKNKGYKNKNTNIHVFKSKFPSNSFLSFEKQINISSPELTFCMLSQNYGFAKLALFGLELCSTYVMPNDLTSDFSRDIQPITDAKKIFCYAKKLQKNYIKFPGIRNALELSKFIVDNSASPMESRLFILLAFPYKWGGFNIKNLKLNQPLKLSKDAFRINGGHSLIPDLIIEQYKIAIEYDSNQFHENAQKNIRDKSRLNALNHDGWKTFTFVPGFWKDIEALRNLCFDISKAINQRPRIRSKGWDFRNRELIEQLYL